MSTQESSLTGTPDVTADSSPAPIDTGAPQEQSTGQVTPPVQDKQPSTTQAEDDVLAGFPPDAEMEAAVANKTPFAEMAARIKAAYGPLKSQFSELQTKFSPFESVADRFQSPEEVQAVVDLRENLMGWQTGPNGQLQPSTSKFIESLDPTRANFLFADFIDSKNPVTGEPRVNDVIKYLAANPELRASALSALGGVEPSAVAPQWQATDEQLAVVNEDLRETFKKLPYDKREALSTNEPDFINDYLAERKLKDDLVSERESRAQQDQQRQQEYQQQLQQESAQAGDTYVDKLLLDGLTTFHNSVVEQCSFIAPLDLAQLPQGMSPEQATAMNAQIAEANKAEAAQITAQIVALINPQTRRYMLPTLKEIGVVDDKLMGLIDAAANATGDNGRNYGHLLHQNSRTKRDYQPGPDVTPLNNEAQRNFKLLVHYANQIKGRLMEKRSQFFAMKATGHNTILNGGPSARPGANGSSFDPTTATTQQPQGWLSRADIERQYS